MKPILTREICDANDRFHFKEFQFGHAKVKGQAALRKQMMFNRAYVANSGRNYGKMSHKLKGWNWGKRDILYVQRSKVGFALSS